jgi:hypothetical protein
METSKLYLLCDGFLIEKKWAIASTFASRLMHVLSLSQQKKNPPDEAILGMVMRRPINALLHDCHHQRRSPAMSRALSG